MLMSSAGPQVRDKQHTATPQETPSSEFASFSLNVKVYASEANMEVFDWKVGGFVSRTDISVARANIAGSRLSSTSTKFMFMDAALDKR